MKKRTKLISLLTGITAVTAMISVPATAADPPLFVVVSNHDGLHGQDVWLTEHAQDGSNVRGPQKFTVGANNAHYWTLDKGDWIEATGPDGVNFRLASTDTACFRINAKSHRGPTSSDATMERVTDSCNIEGATETPW